MYQRFSGSIKYSWIPRIQVIYGNQTLWKALILPQTGGSEYTEGRPAPLLKKPMATRWGDEREGGHISEQNVPTSRSLRGCSAQDPKAALHETIFLKSAASQKVAFFLQSKLEWKLVRWPIHTFGRLVFLFLGILLTPKVGPAEPFVHRHLPRFPENKT